MLVVTRKENETVRIEPRDGIDPSITLREAFAAGPIVVTLAHVGTNRVRLAIDAPESLRIKRGQHVEPESTIDVGYGADTDARGA